MNMVLSIWCEIHCVFKSSDKVNTHTYINHFNCLTFGYWLMIMPYFSLSVCVIRSLNHNGCRQKGQTTSSCFVRKCDRCANDGWWLHVKSCVIHEHAPSLLAIVHLSCRWTHNHWDITQATAPMFTFPRPIVYPDGCVCVRVCAEGHKTSAEVQSRTRNPSVLCFLLFFFELQTVNELIRYFGGYLWTIRTWWKHKEGNY